jgi:hypothetical protein
MEMFEGLDYDSIMSMPSTRRIRMIRRKSDLEQKRADHARSEASRARTRK